MRYHGYCYKVNSQELAWVPYPSEFVRFLSDSPRFYQCYCKHFDSSCESQAHLQCGKHNAQFAILQVLVHQVVNEVDLGPQMLYACTYHHIQKHWEQVVHTPQVILAYVCLHYLVHTVKRSLDELQLLSWAEGCATGTVI